MVLKPVREGRKVLADIFFLYSFTASGSLRLSLAKPVCSDAG